MEGATSEKWARLRFAIVGPLLVSPPPEGGLKAELERLSRRSWDHPSGRGQVRFAASTIERWYYEARAKRNPVAALGRKTRSDKGRERALSPALIEALRAQHRAHPSWSAQLHWDNLAVLAAADPSLGPMPSYATLVRAMRRRGLTRKRRSKWFEDADPRPEPREVLSYEVSRSHAMWHADAHHSSHLRVLTPTGEWKKPILIGVMDDHSRLGCHAQWYLAETAEIFVHALTQAFMKRGLPRSLMTDNGSPMVAEETRNGLHRLGVLAVNTQVRSPHQNGKIENFWNSVETRLMAMLEGVAPLTLKLLNDATIAWLEHEHNRRRHRELGCTPLERLKTSPDASRPCPDAETVRARFCIFRQRALRRSDATISVEGVRLQLPAQWRHLARPWVRFARWDLSRVDLMEGPEPDARRLCALYPVDKRANASAGRRPTRPAGGDAPGAGPELPPLLRQMLDARDATGLPPAWLPFDDDDGERR